MKSPYVTVSGHVGMLKKNYNCLILQLYSWLEIVLISQYDDLIINTIDE